MGYSINAVRGLEKDNGNPAEQCRNLLEDWLTARHGCIVLQAMDNTFTADQTFNDLLTVVGEIEKELRNYGIQLYIISLAIAIYIIMPSSQLYNQVASYSYLVKFQATYIASTIGCIVFPSWVGCYWLYGTMTK